MDSRRTKALAAIRRRLVRVQVVGGGHDDIKLAEGGIRVSLFNHKFIDSKKAGGGAEEVEDACGEQVVLSAAMCTKTQPR
ncbi:hypothetical protein FZEAL_3543 [Fusarium zealandicum]|uniref:Uncharacterized protein n=1 Tax=Fusarium zealandicum TaxID=1053134 RepID=A0A8H4XMB6_9HYPO|nr:hypothetical protein FZEAL_3543 [Fusarium zealandicum]